MKRDTLTEVPLMGLKRIVLLTSQEKEFFRPTSPPSNSRSVLLLLTFVAGRDVTQTFVDIFTVDKSRNTITKVCSTYM